MSDRLPAELREELDRVRLDNQLLRAQLLDATTTHSVLSTVWAGGVRAVRWAARRLRSALPEGPPSRQVAESPPPVAPYVVRRIRSQRREYRPRVLHVIANFHLGGSSRLVVDLVEHLDHCYEQEVVSWDVPPVPAYVGLRVDHEPRLTAARVETRLRACRPALIHVHFLAHHRDPYSAAAWSWYRHWFAAAERLGIPVIENVNIPTDPYVSDAVACYVHVSDYVRQRFGRSDGRHVTIHPGSDLSRFARRPGAVRADDCIGMTYRLEGDKLDERSIDPFIDVVRRRPAARALIVGGGRFLEPYRSRATAAGLTDAFTFTGYVPFDELPALYERMGVFVAPVHRESFGQVSVFAMGMELPVVGYRVGALEEITGDPELLAPPGDPERLAEIIVGLLDDPDRAREIGVANRRRAEGRFSVGAMVSAYEALYSELTGVPRAPVSGGSA